MFENRLANGKLSESEADKLFEELGYKKIVEHKYKQPDNDDVTELILYRDYSFLEIEFWNDKTISKSSVYDDDSFITMQELKAINKKVEELGWI